MSVLPVGFGSSLGGYQIERSLRFNSADSAYLNRTAGTPTNQIKWTFSGWIKRSAFGAFGTILSGGSTVNDYSWYGFSNDDKFYILHNIGGAGQSDNNSASTMVFRDPSAWYHIIIVYDSANATAANRTILYVNGVQQTISAFPSLNEASSVNANGITQYIAQRGYSAIYNNCYMTEVNFIDGQALTPSDFGETDSNTGVWKPKAFSGTYGTNGFYLNFSDNSGTTSTTLGKDYSGNGNNWTPNNFSVTAGAGNDSMVDSPTAYGTDTGVGGEVRGTYATLNAVAKGSTAVLSNGNLQTTSSGRTSGSSIATIAMPNNSGKYYWEVSPSINVTNSDPLMAGVIPVDGSLAVDSRTIGFMTYCYTGGIAVYYQNSSTTLFTISSTLQTTDTLRFAYDSATNKIWLGLNGNWYNSTGSTTGDPANGTNATQTVDSTKTWVANGCVDGPSSLTGIFNFGQRAFAYTAPSGFKALCTQNLPTPTIGATSTTQAGDYFNVGLWTGNSSAANIAVTGIGFQPDFFWGKLRSAGGTGHRLIDSIRGVTKTLYSNATNAEGTESDAFASFDSDGFTIGKDTTGGGLNYLTNTAVGWVWKANGAGSSNTSGSITSTVSANTTSGFSIVTYTGNNVSGATVGHGLGVAPSMIIIKNRTSSEAWPVYHAANTSAPETDYLVLNTTAATADATTPWNDTLPSSTVFTLGNWNALNENGSNHVAYCFAAVAGYSAFGSYTGNGSATDGTFVYTGFRPRWILVKNSGAIGSWCIYDAARNTYNLTDARLNTDNSNAEAVSSTQAMDIVSNGFKLKSSNTDQNGSSNTYIYAAFAEVPVKYSLAR